MGAYGDFDSNGGWMQSAGAVLACSKLVVPRLTVPGTSGHAKACQRARSWILQSQLSTDGVSCPLMAGSICPVQSPDEHVLAILKDVIDLNKVLCTCSHQGASPSICPATVGRKLLQA